MSEYLFKVIVIGEAGVGKTSVIKRYVENVFSTKYRYTIGVDFALKVIEWDADTTVRLQLWDIAGQERFGIMTHVYYKEAAAACVTFDITQRKTFEAAEKWKDDIDSKVHLANGETVPTILLANKADLASDAVIADEEIEMFAREKGFIGWFKTSAKENLNIDPAMKHLVLHILDSGSGVSKGDGFRLDGSSEEEEEGGALRNEKSGCCS